MAELDASTLHRTSFLTRLPRREVPRMLKLQSSLRGHHMVLIHAPDADDQFSHHLSPARRWRASPLFLPFDGTIKRSRRPRAAACHEFGLHSGPLKHGALVVIGPILFQRPSRVPPRFSNTQTLHPSTNRNERFTALNNLRL